MVGAPGAGKSTAARHLATRLPGALVMPYDGARKELVGDPADLTASDAATELVHTRLAHRCATGRSTVVDGTHATPERRAPVLRIAAAADVPIVAVVLATPLRICLARQLHRPAPHQAAGEDYQVPDDVIREMHAEVVASIPGLHREGFTSVHVLNLHGMKNGKET